jgi:hypothetical protein
MTYGLEPNSPEFRVIQKNFSYLADTLGTKGMVITGNYEKEFRNDFVGFLTQVEEKLFSISEIAKKYSNNDQYPVPALTVLKKIPGGRIDIAYLSIRNLSEQQIIAIFRTIIEYNGQDRLFDIPNNLLAKMSNLGGHLWDAIQIKPSFFGLGVDVKQLLKRAK